MKGLANRLDNIKPSVTLGVTQRAAQLRAEGVDIISFSAGEPDFDTPPHIVEAANKAMSEGKTRYTAAAGIPELRGAVAQEHSELRGVPCRRENVIISVGAKHSLYEFFQAVLDPGDEVVIAAPYWVSYPDQVMLADGKPVVVSTTIDDGFCLTPDALKKAIGPKTKALVLNTPSNPSGAYYKADILEEITRIAVDAGIWIVSDEIYRDLLYGDAEHTSPLAFAPEYDRIFVVDGVSKTYAMTGWRIGWGIGHADLIKAMSKIQGQSTSNPSTMAQWASLAAVQGPKDFLTGWKAEYEKRRNTIVASLNSMPGVRCAMPSGAFYVLPSVEEILERMETGATDVTLANYLLEHARIAVVPGSGFGAPGHIRLSYATSISAVEEGMKRMAASIENL